MYRERKREIAAHKKHQEENIIAEEAKECYNLLNI